MKTKLHESLLTAAIAIQKNEVEGLNSIFLTDFYSRPCIYFLQDSKNNGEIVYIGKSKSLGARLGAHYKDSTKFFDSFGYIFVTHELLFEMEEILISVFQPKYNEQGNNWLIKKIAEYARVKNISHVKKNYGLHSGNLSLEKVIDILECDGNMGKWLAKTTSR